MDCWVLLLALTSLCSAKEINVTSKAGTFIGSVKTVTVNTDKDLKVARFLGIPFAEAPVGERRFSKPVAKGPLELPYNATYFRPACLQGKDIYLLGYPSWTSEDCLYLNLIIPYTDLKDSQSENYPVMIWIDGVGFTQSFSNPYTGDTLSAVGEVIVVTLNYRLSVWGFGSTGDKRLPGNYGLWDQHLAIQWVHDNIAAFGGDPSRVTLFGGSAGSASVTYQALYPGNKGLIHRGIAQSGSCLCHWAFSKQPKKHFDKVAEEARCINGSASDTEKIISCMRQLTENSLRTAVRKSADVQFAPVVDGTFVLDKPEDMVRNSLSGAPGYRHFRSLDWLNGVTNGEGYFIFPTRWIELGNPDKLKVSRGFLKNYLLNVANHYSGDDAPSIVKKSILAEYTDWSDPNNATLLRDGFVKLVADTYFHTPLILQSNQHALRNKAARTFLYHLDLHPKVNVLTLPSWGRGLNHGGDLPYVFGFDKGLQQAFLSFQDSKADIRQIDQQMSNYIMRMWSNFAKTGNPNLPEKVELHWPEYQTETKQYLNITDLPGGPNIGRGLYGRTAHFWLHLVPGIIKAVSVPPGVDREPGASGSTDTSGTCSRDGGCPAT